ncbi:MAG: FkbM family methyltransferase [Bacteroidota bacterium]|nr:FkbM family methyltransferase [Bacteroidota bacterium]
MSAKKSLFRYLSLRSYLRIHYLLFRLSYRVGLLKSIPEYKYHYFIKSIIKKGDCVVDIGANLGYFSVLFAELTKPDGLVVSIEPVPIFFEVLSSNLKKYSHCVLYRCALGLENRKVQLTLPSNSGYLRTGIASISENSVNNLTDKFCFEADMKIGSELLNNLNKIDYIKCDVEGYEKYVLPELKGIIEKHLPILQIEIWGENKKVIFELMESLGYERFSLIKGKLFKDLLSEKDLGDFLFIHKSKNILLN